MHRVFSRLDPKGYAARTRSVRIGGHVTSIRLEAFYWEVLEEIADAESMSLGRLLTALHNDVLACHGEVRNFASVLRCSCLIYEQEQAEGRRGAKRHGSEGVAPSAKAAPPGG